MPWALPTGSEPLGVVMSSGAQTSDFVTRLNKLDACAVSDAVDKMGLRGAVTGLRPMTTTRRIAGRILTIKLGVGEPPPGVPRHIGTTAIESARAGDIVVVEQLSGIPAAAWGGILSHGAKLRGLAGVIAEGLVRDVDEARQLDFPVYARGATTLTARGRIVELANNQLVRVGDVEVKAGDYAIADSSGAVFISADNIERVLAMAEDIAAREARMAEALERGQPITEVMGVNYENMLRR
jgi:4-hydroxy-4-methyl-2-oxoglutarate aldolase